MLASVPTDRWAKVCVREGPHHLTGEEMHDALRSTCHFKHLRYTLTLGLYDLHRATYLKGLNLGTNKPLLIQWCGSRSPHPQAGSRLESGRLVADCGTAAQVTSTEENGWTSGLTRNNAGTKVVQWRTKHYFNCIAYPFIHSEWYMNNHRYNIIFYYINI